MDCIFCGTSSASNRGWPGTGWIISRQAGVADLGAVETAVLGLCAVCDCELGKGQGKESRCYGSCSII